VAERRAFNWDSDSALSAKEGDCFYLAGSLRKVPIISVARVPNLAGVGDILSRLADGVLQSLAHFR
jgi:hypothetical protein